MLRKRDDIREPHHTSGFTSKSSERSAVSVVCCRVRRPFRHPHILNGIRQHPKATITLNFLVVGRRQGIGSKPVVGSPWRRRLRTFLNLVPHMPVHSACTLRRAVALPFLETAKIFGSDRQICSLAHKQLACTMSSIEQYACSIAVGGNRTERYSFCILSNIAFCSLFTPPVRIPSTRSMYLIR